MVIMYIKDNIIINKNDSYFIDDHEFSIRVGE